MVPGVTVADAATGKPAVSWPVRLTWDQTRALCAQVGLRATPSSPISAVLSGLDTRNREPLPMATEVPVEIFSALRTLALTRQMLELRSGRDHTEVSVYFNDGEHVVRFASGAEGIMFGRPAGHREFAEVFCALAQADREDTDAPPETVSRWFIDVIGALRAMGVATKDRAPVERAVVEAALEETLSERTSAGSAVILAALEVDGVVEADANGVRATQRWLAEYAYLGEDPVASLRGVEMAGGSEPPQPVKEITVFGNERRHFVFAPATAPLNARDELVTLAPAEVSRLLTAVELFVGPPLSPPVDPVGSPDRATGLWISAARNRRRQPEWRNSAMVDLFSPQPEMIEPPPALLAPAVTVDVTTWSGVGADSERRVIALASGSAVEWMLSGARVLWRELDPEQVASRWEALASDVLAPADERGFEVSVAGLEWLIHGRFIAPSDAPELVPAARSLADDAGTRWRLLRVKRGVGEGRLETELLTVTQPAAGTTWLFQTAEEGGGYSASATSPEAMRDTISTALTSART